MSVSALKRSGLRLCSHLNFHERSQLSESRRLVAVPLKKCPVLCNASLIVGALDCHCTVCLPTIWAVDTAIQPHADIPLESGEFWASGNTEGAYCTNLRFLICRTSSQFNQKIQNTLLQPLTLVLTRRTRDIADTGPSPKSHVTA